LPNDRDNPGSTHVSLRVPSELIAAFDRLATALERPRSWVMVRALRQYVEDGEGAEIEEDTESLAALDRGEIVSSDDLHTKLAEMIAKAERSHAKNK
jgi:predicted transcriptional regulator